MRNRTKRKLSKVKKRSLKKKTYRGFRTLKERHGIKDVPLSKEIHKGTEASHGKIDYHYQSYSNVMNVLEILPESPSLCIFPRDEAFLTLDMENIKAGVTSNEISLKEFKERLSKCLPKARKRHAAQRRKGSGYRFVPIILNIVGKMENHANILLIDTLNKHVELYEPHGYATSSSTGEWGVVGAYKKKIMAIQDFLKENVAGYEKIIDATNYVQETAYQLLRDPEESTGYCVTWTILFIHYRLLNPDLSLKILMKYIHKRVTTVTLQKYAKYLETLLKKTYQ